MRFFTVPWLLQKCFPKLLWRKATREKVIYLTFDDGPIPVITDFVLTTLAQYQARATFFCVGENVCRHADIARRVWQAGHRLGNHTFNHVKGWQTPVPEYLDNIALCAAVLEPFTTTHRPLLFRPPYGRIKRSQLQQVNKKYQVVMWDMLTYDFDDRLPAAACLAQAIRHTRPGAVVVFHDSLKASCNLQYVLPRYLAHFAQLGYRFETL